MFFSGFQELRAFIHPVHQLVQPLFGERGSAALLFFVRCHGKTEWAGPDSGLEQFYRFFFFLVFRVFFHGNLFHPVVHVPVAARKGGFFIEGHGQQIFSSDHRFYLPPLFSGFYPYIIIK